MHNINAERIESQSRGTTHFLTRFVHAFFEFAVHRCTFRVAWREDLAGVEAAKIRFAVDPLGMR